MTAPRLGSFTRPILALWCLGLLAASPAGCALQPVGTAELASAVTLTEGFEGASKTSYAGAELTLGSGAWWFEDALIGTSSSDVKVGTRGARVRGSGSLTMLFDRTTGAGTLSLRHALYGSDTRATWGLFASRDQGESWTQQGVNITTTNYTGETVSFTIDASEPIRFEIRKLDGTSNRLNIDDITITDHGDGGGGGGGGGGGSGADISRHTALGLPAPASVNDSAAYLAVKPGFVISYNGVRKGPNWVAWELNSSYRGESSRQSSFRGDSAVPVPQARNADFSDTGYDRGHNCPSADRTWSVEANSETFLLTNILPQSANNNRGPWERLETYSRSLLTSGRQLFIVSGGIYSDTSNVIGDGVVVPDQTFKVVVVLDSTEHGAADVTTATRVIAVMMPNEDSEIAMNSDWRSFRVPVDAIEAATGYDFLSDVAPEVQSVIEATADNR